MDSLHPFKFLLLWVLNQEAHFQRQAQIYFNASNAQRWWNTWTNLSGQSNEALLNLLKIPRSSSKSQQNVIYQGSLHTIILIDPTDSPTANSIIANVIMMCCFCADFVSTLCETSPEIEELVFEGLHTATSLLKGLHHYTEWGRLSNSELFHAPIEALTALHSACNKLWDSSWPTRIESAYLGCLVVIQLQPQVWR